MSDEGFSLGIAEASRMGEFDWYVNRVLISRDKDRGKGWGEQIVSLLLEQISRQKGQLVMVEPGGYGADPERQQAFYEKCGFVRKGHGLSIVFEFEIRETEDGERSKPRLQTKNQ